MFGLSQRDVSIQLTVEKANKSDHLDHLDLTFIIDSGGKLSNGIRLLREGGGYQLSIKHTAGQKETL